ncbi:WD repeat-containing protein wat1 [Rozella allomycis CSF55]|uniref:WD repeat-containing protein wat1 n=1 Tax=Rozella allomycis (strain CSF55) TaxID=988480 RepID=A0A075AZE2_ROZAC|nr:hypothetical protein O9G_004975 [Rozella allomycis CSF55]RKP17433.1 WD repeat-containing protein wat1 [Rozella allomycis CSF55]|eukprot:EPZ35592.1 hypothetical protein O9G_004975 [Rozella allomycis CSF55]
MSDQGLNPSKNPVILCTAGYDHTIRFWEALSGMCIHTVQHPESQVNSLAISPDKRFVIAAGNPHIRMYDITQSATSGPVKHIAIYIIGASKRMFSNVYRTPKCQRDYEHKGPVNHTVLHPNQGELISCDQLGKEDVSVNCVSVASDGSFLVAANNHGYCFVWKMSNGQDSTDLQPITRIHAHDTYVTKCVLSPDVKKLATSSADGTIKIWATDSFLHEKTLVGHQKWVWDCSFSADSVYLISASSDQTARLWDLQTGDTIRQYVGHNKALTCVALNDLP